MKAMPVIELGRNFGQGVHGCNVGLMRRGRSSKEQRWSIHSNVPKDLLDFIEIGEVFHGAIRFQRGGRM
jgi:hypothetical protein